MGTPSRSPARLTVAGASLALVATTMAGGAALAQDELSGDLRVDFIAYGDPKLQPWLDQAKADFVALHPNVNLTIEVPNLQTYRDSITTQASGGAPPDVAQIATSWLPPLADAGVRAIGQADDTAPDAVRMA